MAFLCLGLKRGLSGSDRKVLWAQLFQAEKSTLCPTGAGRAQKQLSIVLPLVALH